MAPICYTEDLQNPDSPLSWNEVEWEDGERWKEKGQKTRVTTRSSQSKELNSKIEPKPKIEAPEVVNGTVILKLPNKRALSDESEDNYEDNEDDFETHREKRRREMRREQDRLDLELQESYLKHERYMIDAHILLARINAGGKE